MLWYKYKYQCSFSSYFSISTTLQTVKVVGCEVLFFQQHDDIVNVASTLQKYRLTVHAPPYCCTCDMI